MSALDEWLANPTIRLVQVNDEEVERLTIRNKELETEVNRLRSLYGQECTINMYLQDILKAHGINWR